MLSKVLKKCPKCGEEYEVGLNFCRRCESVLDAVEVEGPATPPKTPQEVIELPDEDTFEKEVIKKKEEVKEIREEIQRSLVRAVIKELLLIKDEKKRYEKLLQNLEEKKGNIPKEVYSESKTNYENSLMEIAKRFKELRGTYTGLKERIGAEIQNLEKELVHLKGKLYELKKMSETGLILKKDQRVKEKRLRDEITAKENELREKRRLQNILSLKEKPEGMNKWTLAVIATAILFIVSALYLFTKIPFKKPEPVPPQVVSPLPAKEVVDLEGVRELLEKIKRANLEKDIELFESCYSPDYEELNKRIEKALTLWENFDFIHLEYILKDNIIKEREGTIRVSWDIKVRSRDKGEIKEMKDDLTVFIIKNENSWKIKRVIKEKT